MTTSFSVLMSVYHKENPIYLQQALYSIWDDQVLKPTEIVIIKDGQLTPDLDQVLDSFQQNAPVKLVQLATNVGLGAALKIGLEQCSFEIIARMDSDDIATKNRFDLQINYLLSNPSCYLVGSAIEEFQKVPGDLKRLKRVPESDKSIKRYLYNRAPFNHPTVVFRKSAIIAAGSYLPMNSFEDYYLWFRLIKSGGVYYNFKTPLLHFRVGNDMIGRRHGIHYAINEFKLFKKLRQEKYISVFQFIKFTIIRFPLRLLPKWLLNLIYFKILR